MSRTAKRRPAVRGKPKKVVREEAVSVRLLHWAIKWIVRTGLTFAALIVLAVVFYSIINPPTTPYIMSESRRLNGVDRAWISLDEISPYMARSVVAAEDANFCKHWGFDVRAIRAALDEGGGRGASTISQQVVKNVYLWQDRSWARKALEALMTPLVEAVWTKHRILEVYLNVAEFDEGVFGIEAASRHYFGIGPENLSATQAALLAAILPDPKDRSASFPSDFIRNKAAKIVSGADTIRVDGRAACFDD